MKDKRFRVDVAVEMAAPLSVAIAGLACAVALQNFMYEKAGTLLWWPIVLSLVPLLFLYAVLRLALPAVLSALLVAGLDYVLSEASGVKLALSGQPLAWADISSSANASVIGHYVTPANVALVAGFVLLAALSLKLDPPRRRSLRGRLVSWLAVLVLAPIALYPYLDKINHRAGDALGYGLQKLGLRYVSWDWPQNQFESGLAFHLVQTSVRKVPRAPTQAQWLKFDGLTQAKLEPVKRPKNIILILCEACWHDEKNFSQAFEPLRARGFQGFRAISPGYGGGTVQASFEILTGLPATGALSGVIYQEYADMFLPRMHAYPHYMQQAGYQTFAAHNHFKRFWRRDIVNPKLGFGEFVGLEDMHYEGDIWAQDSVLFDAALGRLRKDDKPKFMYLATVHLHGAYKRNNDLGEGDYNSRLTLTLSQMAAFVDEALKIEPDTLIVTFGDHKPALTSFFYAHDILPHDQFSETGPNDLDFQFVHDFRPDLRGDVPVYAYYRDPERLKQMVQQAAGKPYFCLGKAVDSEFTRVGVPAYNFAGLHETCTRFAGTQFEATVKRYPRWLYSASLFRSR